MTVSFFLNVARHLRQSLRQPTPLQLPHDTVVVHEGSLYKFFVETTQQLAGRLSPQETVDYCVGLLALKQIASPFNRGVLNIDQAEFAYCIPRGCRWLDIASSEYNLAIRIERAMHRIEARNGTLRGVFGDLAWTKRPGLSDSILWCSIFAVSSFDLGPSEKIGEELIDPLRRPLCNALQRFASSADNELYYPDFYGDLSSHDQSHLRLRLAPLH